MDIVKASLLSPSLGPVTFMEEKQGFGFVFATQSRFEVGQNYGNPKFFFFSSSFQRVEHCNFSFAAFVVLEHTYTFSFFFWFICVTFSLSSYKKI